MLSELINNLDNWALVQLFGGTGAIAIALTIFISKLLNQRLIQNWKKKNDIEIAELNGKLNQNNTIISSLTHQLGQSFQKILERRIEAVDIYWKTMMSIKSIIPSSIHVVYQILQDSEINNQTLDQMKSNFGQQIKDFDDFKFISDLSSFTDQVTNIRPFISEKLWILIWAYQGFIGRCVYLVKDGYEKKNIPLWKNDSGVKQILDTALTETEIKHVFNLKVYAFDYMLQLMENKAIEEIKKFTSSEELTSDSLTLLDRIKTIEEQQEPNRRSSSIG